MNDDRFDPLKIVQAFNHRGVEYVVIGGYAGELHAAAVVGWGGSGGRQSE